MVHIGDTEKRYDPKVIHPLLGLLEPGDILTHYFTPNPGGILDARPITSGFLRFARLEEGERRRPACWRP